MTALVCALIAATGGAVGGWFLALAKSGGLLLKLGQAHALEIRKLETQRDDLLEQRRALLETNEDYRDRLLQMNRMLNPTHDVTWHQCRYYVGSSCSDLSACRRSGCGRMPPGAGSLDNLGGADL